MSTNSGCFCGECIRLWHLLRWTAGARPRGLHVEMERLVILSGPKNLGLEPDLRQWAKGAERPPAGGFRFDRCAPQDDSRGKGVNGEREGQKSKETGDWWLETGQNQILHPSGSE